MKFRRRFILLLLLLFLIVTCPAANAGNCDINWAVDADGFWDEGSNWDLGRPPTTNESVCIDRPAGDFSVTVRTFVNNIAALDSNERVIIDGAGPLSGVIGAQFTFHDGIDILQGYISIPNGTVTLQGASSWSSSQLTFSAVVENHGTLTISGPDRTGVVRLRNFGDVQHQSGNIDIGGATTIFVNEPGGQWSISEGITYGPNFTFTNEGTVHITEPGTVTLNSFANNGTVHAAAGTLIWGRGTSRNGVYEVEAGATIQLNPPVGTLHWSGTQTGTGAGRIEHIGGILDTAGNSEPATIFDFAPDLLHIAGGYLRRLGNQQAINQGMITFSGASAMSYGTYLLNEGTVIHDTSAAINFTSSNSAIDTLSGGTLRLVNSGNWTGGGRIINRGTLLKNSLDTTLIGANLTNLGGTVLIQAGSLELGGSAVLSDTTYVVETGATLAFAGGNNCGQGVEMFGSQIGSGGGSITFDGCLDLNQPAGTDFPTLDFPEGMFHWIGGQWQNGGFLRPIYNDGFIHISGDEDKLLRASLYNRGTIIHSGNGNLLHRIDGEIYNEGLYDLVSDADIVPFEDQFLGAAWIYNSGTFRKSGGVGTSELAASAIRTLVFSNTGTVEVQSGTLQISRRDIQNFAGGNLSGGIWIAGAGTSLDLAGFDSPWTANEAIIRLEGAAATLPQLASLNSNNGELHISGPDLTASAPFVNAGLLNLGPQTTLSIPGDFTAQAGSTLQLGIAGAPGSGAYGLLNVDGTAALGGILLIAREAGFGPLAGQSYTIATFAARIGTFGLVTGAHPFFAVSIADESINLNAIGSATDLAADPASILWAGGALPGEAITVDFTVENLTSEAVTGSWLDAIYLSRDIVLSPEDTLLGTVPHAGGIPALGSYQAQLATTLPPLASGNYWLLLVVDADKAVADLDRSNNQAYGVVPLTATLPQLLFGVPTADNLQSGEQIYYQLDVPAGGNVRLTLEDAAAVDLLLAYQDLPERGNYDQAASLMNPSTGKRQLLLGTPQAGQYIILLDAHAAAATTLLAEQIDVEISSAQPGDVANGGAATLDIRGAGFVPSSAVTLTQGGGPILSGTVTYVSDGRLFATFNLNGIAPGSYDLVVSGAGGAGMLEDGLTVSAHGGGLPDPISEATLQLQGHGSLRVGRTQVASLFVSNGTGNDIPAPLVMITTTNSLLRLPGDPTYRRDFLLLLANTTDGPAGVLPPGATIEIPFEFLPSAATDFNTYLVDPAAPINWAQLEEALRPPQLEDAAWAAVTTNLQSRLGNSMGQLGERLGTVANYLAAGGQPTQDAGALLAFELSLANYGAIAQRYHLGVFGRGHNPFWEMQLIDNGDSTLIIKSGAQLRIFVEHGANQFVSPHQDAGTVERAADGYILREADGSSIIFDSNGRFSRLQTAIGNELLAGYSISRLTSLRTADGRQISFSYNAAGRVISAVDADGEVATFSYDAANEHLLHVDLAQTAISYTYVTGAGEAREHAIASVSNSAGFTVNYLYDDQGRLQEAQSQDEIVTISYGQFGETTVSNNAGNSYQLHPGANGGTMRQVTAAGLPQSFSYDLAGNLIGVLLGDGTRYSVEYDGNQNPTMARDALGNNVAVAHDAQFGNLQRLADQNNNITVLTYDGSGLLTALLYADGSQETFVRDSRGNVIHWTNRRGQEIVLAYDSQDRLTGKSLPDGRVFSYEYDSRGNLVAAVVISGTNTFSVTVSYDESDRLTAVEYSNGRSLAYAYDAQGRRSRVEDHLGRAITYIYDAGGRLLRQEDEHGDLIVSYSYDSSGRLERKELGNGAFTVRSYDAAGRLATLVNHAPGGAVSSSFSYTYSPQGWPLTMTSLAGTFSFEYDAIGQLTVVTTPAGRAISYTYDAAGNRILQDDSGALTPYAINELNQVIQAGGDALAYDLDGNLISRAGGAAAAYSYDAENRLVAIDAGGDLWEYEYDPLGNLLSETHNGTRTEYLIDPAGALPLILGEFDASNQLLASYTYGHGLVSRRSAADEAGYYAFDGSGNAVGLYDAGGGVLNSYSYLPFGELLSSSESVTNPFGFGGASGVLSTGPDMILMRNRLYDPALGRFYSVDPLGVADRDVNVYRYGLNNPLQFSDPDGLEPSMTTLGIFYGIATDTAIAHDMNALALRATQLIAQGRNVAVTAQTLAGPLAANYRRFQNAASVLAQFGYGNLPQVAITESAYLRAATSISRMTQMQATVAGLTESEIALNFVFGYNVFTAAAVPGLLIGIPAGFWLDNQIERHPGLAVYIVNPDLVDTLEWAFFGGWRISPADSLDPNDITGPAGHGDMHWVAPETPFSYRIRFENDPTATAPAQEVVITTTLDANLDWHTFAFGSYGFGGETFTVPAGRQAYATTLDLTTTYGLWLDVEFLLNPETGVVTWSFRSLDPETGRFVTDPLAGFLPPNLIPPIGDGYVDFEVQPDGGLANGSVITAQALITFDLNAPITTNVYSNVLDAAAPSCAVDTLPAASLPEFDVSWQGADPGGSGIAYYNVYVSDNGGPYSVWQAATLSTEARYFGTPGHSYTFYCRSADYAGYRSPIPLGPQADTTVQFLSFLPVILAEP